MNRLHLGNRVFTEKHGKVKLAHGPYSGHLCPTVTYLRSFDGTRVHRFVHVPHELASFDHAMWMERRTRVTNRLHAKDITSALDEQVSNDDETTVSRDTDASTLVDTECGVEYQFDETGRLSSASYGSDTPEPVSPRSRRAVKERSVRRITRRDGAHSSRLLC
ncbi:MAG: hypothetical protein SGJ27_26870 [Candidatus Melainabacteria bacterium]|nr:hypothetical protein [Candidatus Melainabacteria bacterium]